MFRRDAPTTPEVVKREIPFAPAETKPVVPPPVERKMPTEEELQEIKAKEIEARIMAELPQQRVPYSGLKWEHDVSFSIVSQLHPS